MSAGPADTGDLTLPYPSIVDITGVVPRGERGYEPEAYKGTIMIVCFRIRAAPGAMGKGWNWNGSVGLQTARCCSFKIRSETLTLHHVVSQKRPVVFPTVSFMVSPFVDLMQALGCPTSRMRMHYFQCFEFSVRRARYLGWHLGCSTHPCVIPSGNASHISEANTKPRVKCKFHDIERPHNIAAVAHERNTIATGWSFNQIHHRNVKTHFMFAS